MEGDSVVSCRPASLRLSFRCDPAQVRPAVAKVHTFLAAQGWHEDALLSLDLALVEACNNAIKHSDEAGRSQPIEVDVFDDGHLIEFRVHDHTPGFDWPKKIELPATESESGRGLYLITSLMDYAAYFRGSAGNILILRKTGPAAASLELPQPENSAPDNSKLAETERVIKDLVEELTSCYETLSAIFRYSNEQGDRSNLKVFAQRLINDLLQIIPADWFVLRFSRARGRIAPRCVFAASGGRFALEIGNPLNFPSGSETTGGVEMGKSPSTASEFGLSPVNPICPSPVHCSKPSPEFSRPRDAHFAWRTI